MRPLHSGSFVIRYAVITAHFVLLKKEILSLTTYNKEVTRGKGLFSTLVYGLLLKLKVCWREWIAVSHTYVKFADTLSAVFQFVQSLYVKKSWSCGQTLRRVRERAFLCFFTDHPTAQPCANLPDCPPEFVICLYAKLLNSMDVDVFNCTSEIKQHLARR